MAWTADIERFRALDAERAAIPGSVVFVGSSSIRLWDTLVRDMAPLTVVKRGFGGSRLFDAVYWADVLVTRHDPAAIVLFSGTNDLANPNPKSAREVAQLFGQFVGRVRELGCDAPIAYIAITPTPARAEFLAEVLEANRLIRDICATDDSLQFVDTAPAFLDSRGQPDPSLFVEDGLHLNPGGYAFWTARLKPVLETWVQR
jgi:lysophospholipase L1-like esterase